MQITMDINKQRIMSDTIETLANTIATAFIDDINEPASVHNAFVLEFLRAMQAECTRINTLILGADEDDTCTLMLQMSVIEAIVLSPHFEYCKYFATNTIITALKECVGAYRNS